jgi:hypothetical protein
VLLRYERMQPLFKGYLASKFWLTDRPGFGLGAVQVSAGPFRPHEVSMEHGHILSVVTGAPWSPTSQYHGNRKHATVTLNASLVGPRAWDFHDKYITEFLRFAFEYETPKHFRPRRELSRVFTWRYREKFRADPEYEMLVEGFMWDTHRGKFLPLSVSYSITGAYTNIVTENLMRMARLPFVWFTRRDRRFFDDRPVDRWRWVG